MQLTEIVLLVCLGLVGTLAGRRLQLLRRGGTEVALRVLPARPGRGWHHGVLRYRDRGMYFYRVSSLRPGTDLRVDRRSVTVVGRRPADEGELDLVPAGATVLHLRSVDVELELALVGGALTAFLAWIESSPPGRSRSRA